jgi:hypothetical protein
MAKMVDIQVTKLLWVTTIADITAPTAAELTAGKDLTPYMVTSYKVSFEGSSIITEAGVADGIEINAPSRAKYSGNLVLYRDFTAGVPSTSDPVAIFAGAYEQGYFCRRIGLAYTTAAIAAQKWEVYAFTADKPQIEGGTEAGFLKVTVPLISAGRAALSATVAT